jgi:hypothetical protein
MEPKDRIDVTRNGQRIGYVYKSNDVFIAQLDKSISIRSQSFTTEEKAIQALENFEPSQLASDPHLMALEQTIKIMGKLFP